MVCHNILDNFLPLKGPTKKYFFIQLIVNHILSLGKEDDFNSYRSTGNRFSLKQFGQLDDLLKSAKECFKKEAFVQSEKQSNQIFPNKSEQL